MPGRQRGRVLDGQTLAVCHHGRGARHHADGGATRPALGVVETHSKTEKVVDSPLSDGRAGPRSLPRASGDSTRRPGSPGGRPHGISPSRVGPTVSVGMVRWRLEPLSGPPSSGRPGGDLGRSPPYGVLAALTEDHEQPGVRQRSSSHAVRRSINHGPCSSHRARGVAIARLEIDPRVRTTVRGLRHRPLLRTTRTHQRPVETPTTTTVAAEAAHQAPWRSQRRMG